ncbi:MAG: hypothetical protein DYG89_06355 [Caldilinea sp. CFX5]|nr:hypothetical protein [Caldilinea sp. CFX5]
MISVRQASGKRTASLRPPMLYYVHSQKQRAANYRFGGTLFLTIFLPLVNHILYLFTSALESYKL